MDNSHSYTTDSADETQALAQNLATDLVSQKLICLYGDLGSGKTTFTQGLLRSWGVTGRILSPTYTLMREYTLNIDKKLFHFDVYRTNAEDETLAFTDILKNSQAIILVEWADRIKALLPSHRVDIFFTHNQADSHTIRINYL